MIPPPRGWSAASVLVICAAILALGVHALWSLIVLGVVALGLFALIGYDIMVVNRRRLRKLLDEQEQAIRDLERRAP